MADWEKRGEDRNTKFCISWENGKSFSDEVKKKLIVFEGVSFGEKIKSSRHKP